ncbi:MAG TPA: alpha-glucuronidase family glycosyl hydrolase [Planctomycetota bacterium]|nr:alpha-glucuronidase family glycosyl hydrolase [Planctomycetota bacterium]
MKWAAGVALGVVCGLGCVPRGEMPPDVRSLRQQSHKKTLLIPEWTQEVADELAAQAGQYAGKTLVVAKAWLDPRGALDVGEDVCRFPLLGGGSAMGPTASVPAWLRSWTGAPLKLRGTLHPPRESEEGQASAAPVLRLQSIDFAHPLELAFVQVEHAPDGTWLTAHVENYRGEGARATLEVRFDTFRERHRLPAVAPGGATSARVKLFGPKAPPRSQGSVPAWAELPPERRMLRLVFDDGSQTRVDIAKWLEGPPDSLLDLGYTFHPPGNAVLMLSEDTPEAELERFAALELRSYLAEFTDANLEPREPDSEEPLPAQPLLVVGTPGHSKLAAELVRQAGLEGRVRDLGDDGYLLKSLRHGERPALLVTAAAPRGVVNGVYALLEHYGVRFSMLGARLPARGPFRLPDLDEAKKPIFARRLLVAAGPEPAWAARWSQWQWLAMIDLAAKNRFNEVVFPLDGLEATFAYEPGGASRRALFPFEITPPWSCVAEAVRAHQRGLAILADYARRRGIALGFARRSPQGTLCRAAPPACLGLDAKGVGQPLDVLGDPGDLLALPRVEEMAQTAAALRAAKATTVAVPYRSGTGARISFLARYAWDPTLTPEAHFRGWAGTLCEGEAADKLAKALVEVDRLDSDVLAATPQPFGLGAPLVLPVEEGDLACEWAALRARATGAAAAAQIKGLKDQGLKLRALQARLEPIHAAFREALGTMPPPWEAPLFESAPAAQRGERISEGIYMFRALLGALASVQEGALAYTAGLAEPAEALPQLAVAATKWRKARRILLWIRSRAGRGDAGPTLARVAERLGEQAARLAEWLGPAAEAEPGARLALSGSDAVVTLFRTRNEDVFAAYKLVGQETVQLRLNTQEARIFRRGQPPRTVRAEGGLFLVSLDTVPTYIVARRAAWPGAPAP